MPSRLLTPGSFSRRRFLRQSFAFSALSSLGSFSALAEFVPSDRAAAELLVLGDWGYDDQTAQSQVARSPSSVSNQAGQPALARKWAAEVEETNSKDSSTTTKPRVQRSSGIETLVRFAFIFRVCPFGGDDSASIPSGGGSRGNPDRARRIFSNP